MGRFRSLALTVIVLVAALSASDLSGKGKGGGGKHGGGHKPARHRAAPKVHHAAHHSGPKPNRAARKPARHHASHHGGHSGGHPGGKQAQHSAKPKGPVKVSKPDDKRKAPPKKDTGKKDPQKKDPPKKDAGKKDPGNKKSGKPPEKPKAPAGHPDAKKKDPGKDRRPDAKRREKNRRFVGRRHAERHHFAHFDHHHHWYSFDRHWWHNFVDYPNSCDDGSEMPGDYCADAGDPGSWMNYEALVPPAAVAAEPPPVIKVGECIPISRAGAILAGRLDAMDVENHWLPGQNVSWRTGNAVDDESGPADNGCAFVAAVCARFKIAMAEPVPDNLLPQNQIDWLINEGTGRGWVALDGNVEAQLLANQGWVVVAAWKAPAGAADRSLDGQTAIVRPTSKPVEAVADRGPQLTVAGPQNHNDIAFKDSFPPAAADQVIYVACRPRW